MSLPIPGSGQYMPTLIRTLLENPALEEWQFDPNVFSLLLLSVMTKKGGVIFDVPKESGSQSMLEVVDGVHGICESIFGLDTRHLHLDSSMSTSKIQGYIQDTQYNTRERRRRSRGRTYPSQHTASTSSLPRPNNNIFSTPESGVSTRYHSAESLLAGSMQSNYATPTSVDTLQTPHQLEEKEKKAEHDKTWPDVLVVTGLEDCETPLQMKLCDLVKLSKAQREEEMMVIWVRDQEKSDLAPAWLVDNFVLSETVELEGFEPVPDLPRQALIHPEYIKSLTALLPYTHIHAPITQHLNNLISAASTHPNLRASMTARFFTTLPILVKAHRLLSSPYRLPPGWRENLHRSLLPGKGKAQRFGLGGGQGGVNDWPRRAGEEPNIDDLGVGAEEWYVGPDNVRGVWPGAVRHRVKWRASEQSIMWAMKSSAAGLMKGMRDAEKDGNEVKRAKLRAKRRNDIDKIIDEMLEMV